MSANGRAAGRIVPERPPHRIATLSEAGSHGASEDVVRVVRPAPGEILCLVADGLGGHGAGRLAATIAADTIADGVKGAPLARERLPAVVAAANDAIVAAQGQSAGFARMRTTLVLLHLDASSALWLHCGDSRLYHVRGGAVLARTFDHSLAQMQSGSLGGDARDAVARHALLRSLGSPVPGESRPRLLRDPVPIAAGDRFLLCSDGFWERMDEGRLGHPCRSLDTWLDTLHESAAYVAVERDDASAIAVECP